MGIKVIHIKSYKNNSVYEQSVTAVSKKEIKFERNELTYIEKKSSLFG